MGFIAGLNYGKEKLKRYENVVGLLWFLSLSKGSQVRLLLAPGEITFCAVGFTDRNIVVFYVKN